MLKYLEEYIMDASYNDVPFYRNERYRAGPAIRVNQGDKVIILEKLPLRDEEANVPNAEIPWLAQLITNDDRNGKKIRLYPSEVVKEKEESADAGIAWPGVAVTTTSTAAGW